jgi:hypothetical protein
MNILVFKTNIRYKKQISAVGRHMNNLEGVIRWNVDFDDVDNILRVEARDLSPRIVEHTLLQAGYVCEELED